ILFYRDCANNMLLIEGNEFECEFEDHFIQHQLKTELEHQSSLQIELTKIYILQVLIYLLRKMDNKKELNSSEKWKKSVVKRVQQYIDQNHNRVLRLSEVSQEVSISANYLNSIFKSETGHTIMQYIEDYK